MILLSGRESVPTIAILGTLVITFYYALVWFVWGRSPHRGPVVVQYEPPDGMSAAAVRYLRRGGFDEKVFTAAILGLAVNRVISIEHKKESYFISPGQGNVDALTEDEKVLASALMPHGFGFELNREHHDKIYNAISGLKLALDQGIEKRYLLTDSALLVPGICGSVLLFLYFILTAQFSWRLDVAFLTVFLVGWTQANAVLLLYLVHLVRSAKWLRDRTGNPFGSVAKTLLFAIPFLVGELALLGFLAWLSSVWFIILVLIHMLLVPAAHIALRNTSKSGRAILDRIEGFRRFLFEVETDPLSRSARTVQTLDLFEKYLPFAFALDVQEQWAHKFDGLVAADSVGELEGPMNGVSSDLASLDLTTFGLFVQKWFPFDLGEIKLSIGS